MSTIPSRERKSNNTMSKKTSQSMTVGAFTSLRYRITEIAPLFNVEYGERFTVRDIDGVGNREISQVLKHARSHGAVRVVDTMRYERTDKSKTKNRPLNVWQWDADVRKRLEDYWENSNKLPCGHKAHIYNDPENEELGCRWCAEEGEHPEYSKERVRELL